MQLPVAYALELHRSFEIEAYLNAESDDFRASTLDYFLAAQARVQSYFLKIGFSGLTRGY
jgi:hypothetical protein